MKTFVNNPYPLDPWHQELLAIFSQYLYLDVEYHDTPRFELGKRVDETLNQCPDGTEYCPQCAAIFCPFQEPLHFHHDGCPCCDAPGHELSRDEHLDRMRLYHGIGVMQCATLVIK